MINESRPYIKTIMGGDTSDGCGSQNEHPIGSREVYTTEETLQKIGFYVNMLTKKYFGHVEDQIQRLKIDNIDEIDKTTIVDIPSDGSMQQAARVIYILEGIRTVLGLRNNSGIAPDGIGQNALDSAKITLFDLARDHEDDEDKGKDYSRKAGLLQQLQEEIDALSAAASDDIDAGNIPISPVIDVIKIFTEAENLLAKNVS